MSRPLQRGRAALLGATIGALPATAFGAWAGWVNPWFHDDPVAFLLLALLPGAALGALVGALVGRGSGGGPLALIQISLLAGVMLRPRPIPVPLDLLVFGIDGATWSLADRLALPHLESLQSEGGRAVLNSADPMFSPLLWTTMATGKRPEDHGIRGFRTRSDLSDAARFWEIAGDRSVGTWKWLVTWPPEPRDAGGFQVPAWLAPEPDTWPDSLSFVKEIELSRRLKRKRIGAVRPAWRLALAGVPEGLRFSTLLQAARWSLHERMNHPDPLERASTLQLLRVWIDRDVFITQLHRHRPSIATFTTYATDALGHTHWGLMADCTDLVPAVGEGGGCPAWATAIPDAYQQADAVLGEILGDLQPGAAVMVVSDHGFRSMDASDSARYFAPLTERLRDRASEVVGPLDAARLGHKVILLLQGDDRETQRLALETWLGGLEQASTGAPFYRWEPLPDDPDSIGLTLSDERVDAERLATDTVGGEPLSDYVKLTEAYSGEHERAGMLIVRCGGVTAGSRLPDAELLDVTPTLLGIVGIPAALDMPGAALCGEAGPRVETYDHLAPTTRNPGGAASSDDVNTELLQQLGYIEDVDPKPADGG